MRNGRRMPIQVLLCAPTFFHVSSLSYRFDYLALANPRPH